MKNLERGFNEGISFKGSNQTCKLCIALLMQPIELAKCSSQRISKFPSSS